MAAGKVRRVAIYGSGGVGKSTTASNMSAALAAEGYRVVQIGCDARGDSTQSLRAGRPLPTIFEALGAGAPVCLEDVSARGYGGVLCLETGRPARCAGADSSMGQAFRLLDDLRVFEEFRPDVVLWDVADNALCGDSLALVDQGYIDQVLVLTNAAFLSLFTANAVLRAIAERSAQGDVRLAGLVASGVEAPYAKKMVEEFGARTRGDVISYIPQSVAVARADLFGQTVIEVAPNSLQAQVYRNLARRLVERPARGIPAPMLPAELRLWARDWGERMLDTRSGVVHEMGGI